MKYYLLFIIVLFLQITSFGQSDSNSIAGNYFVLERQPKEKLINKSFPSFRIEDDSLVITNASLRGKIVYLNFWFTTCRPCIAEMWTLNDFYRIIKKDTEVVFLSLTFDNIDRVQRAIDYFKIEYPVYSIPRESISLLNRTGFYPSHVILDKEGIVRYYGTGQKEIKDLKKALAKVRNGG